jgi:hypothetical protein
LLLLLLLLEKEGMGITEDKSWMNPTIIARSPKEICL